MQISSVYEPLQTCLVKLGELSKGLMFSLFVGDVCLVSWARHSFAKHTKKRTFTYSHQNDLMIAFSDCSTYLFIIKTNRRVFISLFILSPLLNFSLPSPDEEVTMLGAGLTAVGEEADVGVVTVSTGAVPVWGDGREEEPAEAPPILFCRGERGLWAEKGRRIWCSQHIQVK